MTLWLVLLAWAAAFCGAVYWGFNHPLLGDFKRAFLAVWSATLTGKDEVQRAGTSESYDNGVMAAGVSMIVAVVAILILFVVTVIWAW